MCCCCPWEANDTKTNSLYAQVYLAIEAFSDSDYVLRDHISSKLGVSNQIKSLLLSHHHSTCALVSEILESVLQTVQKQFTYRQYILTDLYRRQCAECTYIYSVHTVYYLRHTYNYQYMLCTICTHFTLCTHTYICTIVCEKSCSLQLPTVLFPNQAVMQPVRMLSTVQV